MALTLLRPGIVGIGATVSPENQYSLNNALASGFEIVCRREMYGGYEMCIRDRFVGLSLGANVVAARCFGAKDDEGVRNTVQTSVALGLVSGFLLAVVGFFAARVLLELMSCPEDVIGLSTLYLKIYSVSYTHLDVYKRQG